MYKDIIFERVSHNIGDTLFGLYKIDKILGQGGSSTVYKVHNIKNFKTYACKEMDIISINARFLREQYLQRFYREFSVLAKLRHKYIPNSFLLEDKKEFLINTSKGRLKLQKRVYLFIDYIEAKTLDFFIKEGYLFSKEQFLFIFSSLLEVLSFIHSLNYIHGDLKPSNIMIDFNTKLFRLIDFGQARKYDIEERIATPFYHPEGIYKGFSLDIYALLKILDKIRLNDKILDKNKKEFYNTYINLYKSISIKELQKAFLSYFINERVVNYDILKDTIIEKDLIIDSEDIILENKLIKGKIEFKNCKIKILNCKVFSTLYFNQCEVLIKDSYFINSSNSLFFTDSKVKIYNSRFRDSDIAIILYKSSLFLFNTLILGNIIGVSLDKLSDFNKFSVLFKNNIDNIFTY